MVHIADIQGHNRYPAGLAVGQPLRHLAGVIIAGVQHLLHLVAGLLFDVAAVEHAGHGGYGYARLAGNVVYRQAEPPVDM